MVNIMNKQFQIRTDLALEARECIQKKDIEYTRGVLLEEYDVMEDVHISKVEIRTKNAAKNMAALGAEVASMTPGGLAEWIGKILS